MLKFIPGIGSTAGGTLNAAVAATLATTIGMGYIEILHRLFEANMGNAPDPSQVVEAVKSHFSKKSLPVAES